MAKQMDKRGRFQFTLLKIFEIYSLSNFFFIFWRLKRNLNHSRLEFRITTKQQKQNWNYQRWDIVNIPLQSQPLLTTRTFRGIANLVLKPKPKG